MGYWRKDGRWLAHGTLAAVLAASSTALQAQPQANQPPPAPPAEDPTTIVTYATSQSTYLLLW